ncbi:hypothetical protein [Falsiroseomonas sp. E2-1-a20]|uniref:hypothetical protein n=1 Tax=Falsiroseomonas sp. E2-1-a20 TaxID=3239300 RepID=UPI003F3FFD32
MDQQAIIVRVFVRCWLGSTLPLAALSRWRKLLPHPCAAVEVPLTSLHRPDALHEPVPVAPFLRIDPPKSRSWSIAAFGEAVLVFVLALLVRMDAMTGLPPQADELYHFYAARSYLADGSLSVFSGTYLRAADFTRLVAAAMSLFGDSLSAARVPSLLASAVLVATLYLWLRREAGRGAAAIAAALLIFLYPNVLVGTLVRFYALQALLFWLGTALLYRVVVEARPRFGSAMLSGVALLLLVAAARLQIVTLIGLAAFGAWAALYLTWRMRDAVPRLWLVLGWLGLLVATGVLAYAVAQTGFGARLLQTYRSAALWAEPNRDNVFFYYHLLARHYGILGNYLPLAALAAFAFRPRPALYCGVVLAGGLVLHSFGGMKQDRYVAYLMPHLAALWAMALWPLLIALRDRLIVLLAQRWRLARPLVTAAVALLLAALLVKETSMLERTVRSIVLSPDRPLVMDVGRGWQANRARLVPLVWDAEVFIADDDLQAAYHVGRADFFMNRSQLLENDPPDEFVRDFRTGTPMISSADSLRTIFACFDRGLLVSGDLALSWLTAEAREVIAAHSTPLELVPPIHGYVWDRRRNGGSVEPPAACNRLRGFAAETAPARSAR